MVRGLLRVRLGLLSALLIAGVAGCGGCQSAPGGAADAAATTAPEFDGAKAMDWLQRQVAMGPRVPGTPPHAAVQKMLAGALGDRTQTQAFTHATAQGDVAMANIIGQYGPTTGSRILLCAHWDTRPFADQDPTPANQSKPIPGANDGASGVAVLLELSRLFRASPPPVGVTIVLFDGEDWGRTLQEMFLGARYFAEHQVGGAFRYGILLDMIGDSDLQIFREQNSQDRARAVVDRVWKAAADLHCGSFRDSVKYAIEDDHLPLLDKGIPTIDVIDFDYPPWHTLQDTVDKCSSQSLKAVGDVLRRVVYSEQPGAGG